MSVQQVLFMETEHPGLRAAAIGWGGEDPSQDEARILAAPVGMIRSFIPVAYPDPLRAMADGWHLLAPPRELEGGTAEWWFVRDAPEKAGRR